MIEIEQLVVQAGDRRIIDDVTCTFEKGRLYGIIGPNGAGKSTLLGAISGIVPYQSGEVCLKGNPVNALSRKSLAKWLAVLQQEGLPGTMFTVREVVSMARFPFQNWLGDEADTGEAERIIENSLRVMGLLQLASRRLDQLSGGERQRVALAKVLAQQPELILLDEPTTYLDIGYQVQLLDAVRDWQRQGGFTVIAVLHDLNLAALYCDRLLVMQDGRVVRLGTPEEVLTEQNIRDVYGTEAIVLRHPVNGCPQLLLQRHQTYPHEIRREEKANGKSGYERKRTMARG